MANIMINTSCNLRCPYCFAEDCMTEKKSLKVNNMTIDTFKKAIKLCNRSGEPIGIIGGEPLIHPEINDFIKYAVDDEDLLTIMLFTNGIHLDKIFPTILMEETMCKLNMLINVNTPNINKNFDKLVENLDYLYNNGYKFFELGLNLYDENQDEIDIVIDLLKRYNRKTLRFSITIPNDNVKRNIKPLDYFNIMKPKLIELLTKCKDINVKANGDCNYIPSCVFSDDEKELLKEMGFDYLLHNTTCTGGPIDILPDFTAVRCFGMSNKEVIDLNDFNNLSDIRRYFDLKYFYPNIVKPVDEKCNSCYDFKSGKCTGGCLVYSENI